MVCRDRPNSRAACRMLMPSTCTDRLTRAYTSTLYTSQVSHKTLSPCNVLEPKCGGLLFNRHKTPLTRAFCGQLLLRRLYAHASTFITTSFSTPTTTACRTTWCKK